jgi:hypothetical protein
MSQQLQELRGQYASDLANAEEEARKLQAKITDWRAKISAIDTLTGVPETDTEVEGAVEEETSEEGGVFTPVQAYWKPILQVLVEMGGRGKRQRVIDSVGAKMKSILTPADFGNLPKSGRTRWSNRVVWQASEMRAQGLIKNNSPRGLWEITDAGRKWLDDNNA